MVCNSRWYVVEAWYFAAAWYLDKKVGKVLPTLRFQEIHNRLAGFHQTSHQTTLNGHVGVDGVALAITNGLQAARLDAGTDQEVAHRISASFDVGVRACDGGRRRPGRRL